MNVSPCKNASNKTCWYGAEKCWFKHTNACDQENEMNENQEITDGNLYTKDNIHRKPNENDKSL